LAEKCFKRIIDDSKIKEDIVDASLKLARFVYTPWVDTKMPLIYIIIYLIIVRMLRKPGFYYLGLKYNS